MKNIIFIFPQKGQINYNIENMLRSKITVISTVLNEEKSIAELLEALSTQTFPFEEIIVVDAGSKDQTVAIMEKYAQSLPLKVLVHPGATRAEGRNSAIKEAKGDIIASIDGGCIPHPDWLENLVMPLIEDPTVDVVGGFYEPIVSTPLQEALAVLTVPSLESISPMDFLPSSRSIAFRKGVWEKIGGYPEWMKSAEDTVFDLLMKKAGARFLFRPEAIVKWHIRDSLKGIFKQFFEYSYWDARAGVFFPHYHKVWLYLSGVFLFVVSFFYPPLFFLLAFGFLLYILRYFIRAKGKLSPKAYFWLIPVLLAYDLGNVCGFTIGKVSTLLKKYQGGELRC